MSHLDFSDRVRTLVNVGCGPKGGGRVPAMFANWRQLRVDVDESVAPDIIADLTDLSALPDSSADAIWASHCIEHLFLHDVPTALAEFRRVIRDDGFICIIVPDLQTIARFVAEDRLHETLYHSSAGPVTPHDVMFGFGAAIAAGRESMAHRCGFTPSLLIERLQGQAFGEVVVRRRAEALELAAIARRVPSRDANQRSALLDALGL